LIIIEWYDFYFGKVDLKIHKDDLQRFLSSIYESHYKKDRLIHITSDNVEYPHFKITDDLISCYLFFFSKSGREFRFFLDGTFDKRTGIIHLTSIDPTTQYEIEHIDYSSIIDQFKKLTKHADGKILISENGYPKRLFKGKLEHSSVLLNELMEKVPLEKRSEIIDIFNWLNQSYGEK
jgi:hypothetical protein